MRGSTGTVYTVTLSDEGNSCQCVDFRTRKHTCKHIRRASWVGRPAPAPVSAEQGAQAGLSCRLVLLTLELSDQRGWREVGPCRLHLRCAAAWDLLNQSCAGHLQQGGEPRAVIVGRQAAWRTPRSRRQACELHSLLPARPCRPGF